MTQFFSIPEEKMVINDEIFDTDLSQLDIDESHSKARLNFDARDKDSAIIR